MGVADNQSYKDQYHFTDDKKVNGKDYPSVAENPKINTVIKENPYRSNVEIEGKEIVLKPDLTALFKAVGKKHSQGGMDVLIEPNSFVFSDFKGLAINPKEHELFELKEGGSTPAEVLKKNVDIKHYNTLVNILSDPKADDLAKKSAARMLDKYIGTIGNIAYIQEQKKSFPDGIPEFAQNTAPVYNPDLKNEIMANKQYMKAGGAVGNPYMQAGGNFGYAPSGLMDQFKANMQATAAEKAKKDAENHAMLAPYLSTNISKKPDNIQTDPTQITPPSQNTQTAALNNANPDKPNWGLWQGDKLPIFRNRFGVSNAADKIANLDALANQLGYTGPKSNVAFQKWLYNSSPENKAIIDKWHKQYEDPSIAVSMDKRNRFDDKIGIRWQSAINEIIQKKTPPAAPPVGEPNQDGGEGSDNTPSPVVPGPDVPNLQVTPQGVKKAEWAFTPWQKISQAYNWGQYANVKRYMPYRSRYNATYAEPALVNPEQAIGDIKGIANQQFASLGTLNPILRNAQASAVAGQVMNQIPGIRSQYDNQNAGITNQFRQYNNQVKNNESLVNMSNDQTYYQQAVEGRKNFDNMRQFTANNAMNNLLGDVQTNQKLAYNLLTQNNPAYNFDWKSGNFTRTNKNILDVQNPSNQQENLLQLAEDLKTKGYSDALIGNIIKTKAFQSWNPSQVPDFGSNKKGGKVKKNPYK